MNNFYFKSTLMIIVSSPLSLQTMQENRLIKKIKNKQDEIHTIFMQKRTDGSSLKIIHIQNTVTKKQYWRGYRKSKVNQHYKAYYKFDPETARRRWKELNKKQELSK